jgi:hypothetical protein
MAIHIGRREFIATLASGAATWPLPARATWSRTNFRCDLGGALATGYPPATPS